MIKRKHIISISTGLVLILFTYQDYIHDLWRYYMPNRIAAIETKNPMIIYTEGYKERYSVLPAGVVLYKVKNNDNYIMYINIQGPFKSEPNNGVLKPLYLSQFEKGFKRENDEVLTKRDLIRILQKNNISKEDFADIINELKQNKDNE